MSIDELKWKMIATRPPEEIRRYIYRLYPKSEDRADFVKWSKAIGICGKPCFIAFAEDKSKVVVEALTYRDDFTKFCDEECFKTILENPKMDEEIVRHLLFRYDLFNMCDTQCINDVLENANPSVAQQVATIVMSDNVLDDICDKRCFLNIIDKAKTTRMSDVIKTDILPALKCEGSAYRLSWLSTTISRIYSPCPDERALCSGYRYTKLINNYFGDSSPL